MQKEAYRRPDHIAPESDLLPDGAMSPVNRRWDSTHQGSWYIEEQRYGSDAISAGLANNDTTSINRGLRILSWGFRQQQPNGSFNCPDAFHSTSFFVEASAHSMLMLQASRYGPIYQTAIQAMVPMIHSAALWMTLPDVEREGQRRNMPYTHRRYLVAAALGETGILTGDTMLIARSKTYISQGLLLQDSSGYNPEKGGYDCSYHSVGVVYAQRYYDIVAGDDTRPAIYAMLKKAIGWLTTRVRPDGTLNPDGNTRTGLGQEKGRNDNLKTLNYGQAFRSFYRWYQLTGDPAYEDWAKKVVAGKNLQHQ
jgi:hypothetical protein